MPMFAICWVSFRPVPGCLADWSLLCHVARPFPRDISANPWTGSRLPHHRLYSLAALVCCKNGISMIARINGIIEAVNDESVLVTVGDLTYELHVPAVDLPHLQANMGQRSMFFTLEYIEGNASFGQLAPRLLGFLRQDDKAFFQKFITVKGIGPRRALRALTAPVGQIAAAICRKDTKFLTSLPEIGKRTAEQVIAELSGKVDHFATGGAGGPTSGAAVERPDELQQAITALVSLGERRAEAENWVDRVCRADPTLKKTADIVRAAYRLKAGTG